MKMEFPNRQEIFQNLEQYINKDTKICLAISGGADSMLMFFVIKDFFTQKGFDLANITVLHYNHKFRKESDIEQIKLKEIFIQQKVRFLTSDYRFQDFKENALRKARYEFFLQSMMQTSSEYLLLGHNLDDRIETSLLNMLRGCSLRGFTNMNFIDTKISNNTKINILRPLISLPKVKIKEICQNHSINYFEDNTNDDINISKRNFIRKNIVKSLVEKSNKTKDGEIKFYQSFSNIYLELSAGKISSKKSYKDLKLSKYWGADFGYEIIGDFNISDLSDLLKENGGYANISQKNMQEIIDFWAKGKQGYKKINGIYFWQSHARKYIIKAPEDFWQKTIEDKLEITNIGEYAIGDFVFKALETDIGTTLRFVCENDMYKSKKINKVMINKKIPIFWRNFVVVQVKDGEIIDILKIK